MATRTLTYVLLGKDSLSPAFKKAGAEGEAASEGIAGGMSKAGFAGIAVAGIIAGVLTKSLKDARSEGWSPLAVAAKDAGVSFDAFKPKAEAAGTAMAKLGFSQGDVNASLKVLLTSTRNSQLSLNSLGGAADFARFKGIGLSEAATMLAKAATGSTRALKDVGISTNDLPKKFATTGTSADRMRIIMELLNQRIGGQAAAAATTFGGKLEVMHAQLENVSAKIGTALLPILSSLLSLISAKILPVITQFSDWFTKVGSPAIAKFFVELQPLAELIAGSFFAGLSDVFDVLKALGEMFLKLPGPIKVIALGIGALTLAWWAFDAAVDANPIVAWGALIILTVGLITSHWSLFVKFFQAAMHAVTSAAMDVYDWIRSHWVLLATIIAGPIGLAAAEVIKHWADIRNAAANAFNAVVGFFRSLPSRIVGAIGNVGSLLTNIGSQMISGLFRGITGALSSVGSWVKTNIFNPIVGAIKSLFGIHSPSTVMAEMGGHLVGGLILGLLRSNPSAMIGKIFGSLPNALGALIGKGLVDIEHLPAKALSALGGVAKSIGGFFAKLVGGGGGGVGQWMSVVLEALALNGLPSSLASQVLRQISSESGGNPNAINLTDSNAAAGDPSRGLLQTIGSTFSAYHIAGTSSNIYDPLANVAAAINYAKHVYGPSLMSGGNGLGSGHGYALGTNSARAGWAWVGERGPELMKFRGGEQVIPNNRIGVGGGGTNVTWTGNVIVQGHALASKQQLARTVTEAIEYSQRHGNK